MLGRDHLIANGCSLVLLETGMLYLRFQYHHILEIPVHYVADSICHFTTDFGNVPLVIGWISSVLFYFLGALLPDIDNPNSILGKLFYLPVKHRTWTHAIWFSLIMTILSVFLYRPLFWLGLGCLVHIFWDSLSVSGVCLLYPITKYTGYDNGAQAKKHHVFKLYKTGKASEYVVLGFLGAITIAFVVYGIVTGLYLNL